MQIPEYTVKVISQNVWWYSSTQLDLHISQLTSVRKSLDLDEGSKIWKCIALIIFFLHSCINCKLASENAAVSRG